MLSRFAFWRWTWTFESKVFCGLLAMIVLGIAMAIREDSETCDRLMGLARSSRDSLDAAIACEQVRASTAQSIAIGAAAGAVAASSGARR